MKCRVEGPKAKIAQSRMDVNPSSQKLMELDAGDQLCRVVNMAAQLGIGITC
jgi:hypothetical protein